MIESLKLTDWKSFENAKQYIDPLNILIGTNASGKSNVLDAFGFLRQMTLGDTVADSVRNVRGGENWIIRKGRPSFSLEAKTRDDNASACYTYTITIGFRDGRFEVQGEKLVREKATGTQTTLFSVREETGGADTVTMSVDCYTAKQGRSRKIELLRDRSVLYQLSNREIQRDVAEGIRSVSSQLRNIFVLDPVPQHMRYYKPLSSELSPDASNIAGVIAGMEDSRRQQLLQRISDYVRPLPERDIIAVWTETVGHFSNDAMLYCKEQWTGESDSELTLDARGMSDGTLRFIAIVATLLLLPKGMLVLIEEVDNGLHPSRAKELVKVLKEIGCERQVDILCTTHNPVLVDELGDDMIPCISYIARNETSGASEIRLLEDRADFARLLSRGSIGTLMTRGEI